jgi:hypothetical protein
VETHFGFEILITRTEIGGYCSHCQVLREREIDSLREQGGVDSPGTPRTKKRG